MSLRDRVSDLEKKFGIDKDVFKQKCEEYAEGECDHAVRRVEQAIEYKNYEVKGLFRKIKYVEGFVSTVAVNRKWSTATPDYYSNDGSEYIVHNTKEAKAFVACIVSRLEKEGFKCTVKKNEFGWHITYIMEWK